MAGHPKASAPDSRSQFLWETHKYTNEYIRFADTKAAFVFTATSALLAALIGSGLFNRLSVQTLASWHFETWLAIIAGLLLTISTYFAVSVVLPRLWGNAHVGLIFWESVLKHASASDYIASVRSGNTDLDLAVADHIFALGSVAKRKYELIKSSMIFAATGGVCAAFALLVHHIRS